MLTKVSYNLNKNLNKNPFCEFFKHIHKTATPEGEIIFISRMQVIQLLDTSPSNFHAIYQKMANFPKAIKRVHGRDYYSLQEVQHFRAELENQQ